MYIHSNSVNTINTSTKTPTIKVVLYYKTINKFLQDSLITSIIIIIANNIYIFTTLTGSNTCTVRQNRTRPLAPLTDIHWRQVDPKSDNVPTLFPFTKDTGPTHSLSDDSSRVDYYSLIVSTTIVGILVDETNR